MLQYGINSTKIIYNNTQYFTQVVSINFIFFNRKLIITQIKIYYFHIILPILYLELMYN